MDVQKEIEKAKRAKEGLKQALSSAFNKEAGILPNFIETIDIVGAFERVSKEGTTQGIHSSGLFFSVSLTRNLTPEEEKLCPQEHAGYTVKYAKAERAFAY